MTACQPKRLSLLLTGYGVLAHESHHWSSRDQLGHYLCLPASVRALVAIGGINRDNARLALDAGADAIAVISGVFGEASVAEATAALLKIIGSVRK